MDHWFRQSSNMMIFKTVDSIWEDQAQSSQLYRSTELTLGRFQGNGEGAVGKMQDCLSSEQQLGQMRRSLGGSNSKYPKKHLIPTNECEKLEVGTENA